MTDYNAFTAALAKEDQPQAAFAALCALAEAQVGLTLFTVLTIDEKAKLMRRAWSNMPEAYPVKGTKPIPERNGFTESIQAGQPMITNDRDGVIATFSDHELILSLGCESCLNLPIRISGETFGSINLLHVAQHWTPDRVAAVEALRLPAAAAFMADRLFR